MYEHLEYTPYGELWVDHAVHAAEGNPTPFRFTGKELDKETGRYYYGARYLDPKTSRWISADPAMYDGSYIPSAPINDEARKRNGNLPGMGGVFNYVNLHVYHYAGNNPVKLTDPDGRKNVQMTVVTGTTVDGQTMSYSAPSDDAERMGTLNTIQENMKELGWDVHTYQVDVNVGLIGKKVKGAQEVDSGGTAIGAYIDFTSDAIKGNLQGGVANISGSRILKAANNINNAIQFGRSMNSFIQAMNNARDGTAQLAYLLTQPGGGQDINAAANMLQDTKDYYNRGTLAYAKDGALNHSSRSDVYRATILAPATRALRAGISFCYF
jgi:RHS repeat-associated protein